MIKRIVKLSFEPQHIPRFLDIFENSKQQIRQFPGCHHLELLRCKNPNNLFFTYSHWENENALDAYRQSELFKKTWSDTKQLFNDKPQAWSVEIIHDSTANNN